MCLKLLSLVDFRKRSIKQSHPTVESAADGFNGGIQGIDFRGVAEFQNACCFLRVAADTLSEFVSGDVTVSDRIDKLKLDAQRGREDQIFFAGIEFAKKNGGFAAFNMFFNDRNNRVAQSAEKLFDRRGFGRKVRKIGKAAEKAALRGVFNPIREAVGDGHDELFEKKRVVN